MLEGYRGDRRLASGYALYHPDCLFLDLGRTRQELISIDAGGSLARALAHSQPTSSRTEIFGALPLSTKQFVAEIAHEHDHLRRMLGTTYGLLTHRLRTESALALFQLFDAIAEAGPLPILPLLSDTSARGLAQSLRSCRALTAREATLVDYLAPAAALTALASAHDESSFVIARHRLAPLFGTAIESVDVTVPFSNSFSCPGLQCFEIAGTPVPFTSVELFEFSAVAEQGNALLRLGDPLGPVESLLTDGTRHYSFLSLLWNQIFPLGPFPNPLEQPRSDDELVIDYARLYPFELHVLVDLALWIPWGPCGLIARDRALRWSDISPALRFLRLVEVLRGLGITPTAIPPDSASKNKLARVLQETLCEVLGWPTPEQLIDAWLPTLRADSEETGLFGFPQSFRARAIASLFSLQHDRPGDFIVGNLDFNALSAPRAPGWFFRSAPGSGQVEATLMREPQDAVGVLQELLLFKGTRYLALGDERLSTSWEPNLRRAAAESLSLIYQVTGGRHPEKFDAAVGRKLRIS